MKVLLRAMINSSNTSCQITWPNQEEIKNLNYYYNKMEYLVDCYGAYLVLLMAIVCDVLLIPNRTCKMRTGMDLRNQVKSQTSLFEIFEVS